MRKRAIIGGALASAVVVLGSWEIGQAHTATTSTPTTASGTTGTGTTGTGTTASGTTGTGTTGSGTSSGASTATYKDGTYTGSTITTRYGDVQVSVTISGGKITTVTPLHLTDAEQRSVMISAQAAPLLLQEVLTAQSASVDTISGATYTSDGYLQSLQAALDQAG